MEVAVTGRTENSLDVSVRVDSKVFTVWFRTSTLPFVDRSDALLPLALVAAMHTRRPLTIPGTVSPLLLHNAREAQDILAGFSGGELAPTAIVAEPAVATPRPAHGIGAFFGGGVDSMYTVLKHEPEITHLVFIFGFDIFDRGSKRGVAALESAREFARSMGKTLIEVETNLGAMTDAFAPWHIAHGTYLAAVAMLLQSELRTILVPSGSRYRDLIPWGSHPLLDPLWTTESLDVVHDGCEVGRPEKVQLIATSDLALRHLRVCNKQWAAFNCGGCEKCLRTMISLHLAGALERCTTLPSAMSLRQIARLQLDEHGEQFGRENLEQAYRQRDWPMVLTLLCVLGPHPLRRMRSILSRFRRRVATGTRASQSVRP